MAALPPSAGYQGSVRVLIVDTGNGPGKIEEIFGMNKATGSTSKPQPRRVKAGVP